MLKLSRKLTLVPRPKLTALIVAATALSSVLSHSSFADSQPRWEALQPYNAMFENNNTDPIPGQGMQGCLIDAGAESWHSVKADNNGNLLPFCAPDTLYVWLEADRLRSYELTMGNNMGSWPNSIPPIYANKGPLGSFGYGSVSIRLKLKAGVRFVRSSYISDNCANTGANNLDNTVFYRVDGVDTLADWTICSPKVLQSWSYGTRTQYDEMVRDLRVVEKVAKAGGDLRGKMEIYSSKQGTDFFRPFNLDPGVNFSFQKLLSNFANEQNLVSQGGRIFLNPDLHQSQARGEAEHVRTSSQLYFFHK